MKEKIKYIVLICIVALLIIIGLYKGYVNADGATGTIELWGQTFKSSSQLAEYVANNSGCLFDLGLSEIWDILKSKQALINAPTTDKKSAIWFKSGACLYHQVGTDPDSVYEIRDFLEIDARGTTIHHYNGSDIEKNRIDIPGGYGNALAYLMYLKSQEKEPYWTPEDSAIDPTKQVMRAVFKNFFAEHIAPYVSETFYVEGDNSNTWYDDQSALYLEALQKTTEVKSFEKLETSKEPERIVDGYSTYYGPFKLDYTGIEIDTSNFVVNSAGTISGDIYLCENDEFRKVNLKEETVANKEFYIKFQSSTAGEAKSIEIRSTVKEYYAARMFLMVRKAAGAQQMAIFEGTIEKVYDEVVYYLDGTNTREVQIQKVDEKADNLKLSGIEFKVYDSSKNLKGTLTTDANGLTGKISLPAGSYTIKETKNNYYGYGNNVGKEYPITVTEGTEGTKVVTVKFKNITDLGNFQIIKNNEANKVVPNVEFYLRKTVNGQTSYAVLKNASGGTVSTITGGATIAANNVASGSTYKIEWVTSSGSATVFKTNSSGEILINNLEVFYSKGNRITYTAVEAKNPNYGYKGNGNTSSKTLISGATTPTTITNTPSKGHLAINKVDEDNNNIKVEGIVFTIDNGSKYIQLKRGSTVQLSCTGTVNADDYTVAYVDDVNSATKFVTDANGNIKVQNLEVYKNSNTKYAYRVNEFESNNPNYDAKGSSIGVLTQNATTYMGRGGYSTSSSTVFTNKRKNIDISGYVWLENYSGKASELNGKYDSGENKVSGIKVYLKEGTTTVKTATTGTNGEYKFTNVDITKVTGYHIEFEYDGIIYQSTTTGYESKATDATSRTTLDSAFTSVQKATTGTSTVYADSTHNVTYNKAYNPTAISSTSGCNVIATTGTYLKDTFKDGMTEITNVNLGIYKKQQADLALTQDVDNVNVGINGYWHVYKYNQRMSEYDGKGWNVGVKFKNSYSGQYNLPIYEADYEYETENGTNELEVYLTYKIAITNGSSYKAKANKINYYYDNRLSLIGVGKFVNTTNNSIEDAISVTNIKDYNDSYKQITIDLSSTGTLDSGNSGFIYVQFKLNRDAINVILEDGKNNELFNTAAEIVSYTNYNTSGKTLAVVDKDSIPGNYNLGNVAATDEDDSDQAPTIKLVITESRKLTGTVFVDSTTGKLQSGKERLGDGIYNSGEKTIKDVKVQLCKAKDNSVVKETTTDANGNYKFTEFIPDDYIIKFIWGNETYTVYDYKGTIYNNKDRQDDGKWYQDSVDTRNSDAIDDYSLRLEIDSKIKEVSKESIVTIKEELQNTKMESTTPKMEIGVESTDTKLSNLSSGVNKVVEYLIKNVDFGIVERPRQELQLDKDVTAFKIISSTGTILVDATVKDGKVEGVIDHLAYIKDNFIKAEMSEELIQGSTLQITYSLKVTNIGELDYVSEEYYKYGTGKDDKNLVEITPTTVIDYLDSDLGYDSSINTGWLKVSTSDIGIKSEYTLEKNNLNSKIILKNTSLADNSLKPGDSSEELKLTVSKLLATSTDSTFENTAEVISIKQNGGRLIEEFPSGRAEKGMVTPSTGENKDIMFIIVGTVSLIILASGIVVIKKKVLKNK